MAAPIYFVPGRGPLFRTPADLPGDLATQFAGEVISSGDAKAGPLELGPGVFFRCEPAHGEPGDFGVLVDRQRWTVVRSAADGSPAYAIGWTPDKPPTPADLVRRRPLPGSRLVELSDGRRWEIPELHAGAESIPHDFALAGGVLEFRPLPAYRAICDESRRWLMATGALERPADAPEFVPVLGDVVAFAGRLLALNYAVGLVELSGEAFGVLDSRTWWRPIWAALGTLDGMLQFEKKTAD